MTDGTTTAATATASSWGNWEPTKKWWAATVVAIGGFFATLASTGWHWTPVMSGAAITIVTQRVVAYITPNDPTPGGVPGKT
jgi:hypothetical protein